MIYFLKNRKKYFNKKNYMILQMIFDECEKVAAHFLQMSFFAIHTQTHRDSKLFLWM